LAAIAVSFLVIGLTASYYRFQHLVQLAEDTQPEEMGATAFDILRVQMARYLAECARRGTSFTIALIQPNDELAEVHMGTPFMLALKKAARSDDLVCIYDPQTAALLLETGAEDSEGVFLRMVADVAESCSDLSTANFRVGLASYPGHGLSGKELLAVANQGLAETTEERPVILPEIMDADEEDEDDIATEEEIDVQERADEGPAEADKAVKTSGRREKRRKTAMLDDLTGVLKPSAISAYMQRMMSELKRKKRKVALFCIGVNNIESVERIHGKEIAEDVLVGVSKVLQESLRADDLIGRHEKYAFLVLAEASLEDAEIIGRRISTKIQQNAIVTRGAKVKTTVTLGVAVYPEHGRNLHVLYQAGQKVLDHSRENDIRAYAVYDPEIHDSMPSKPMKSMKASG
jgi:diguanylate cyclase (GGDEF)-like protein